MPFDKYATSHIDNYNLIISLSECRKRWNAPCCCLMPCRTKGCLLLRKELALDPRHEDRSHRDMCEVREVAVRGADPFFSPK